MTGLLFDMDGVLYNASTGIAGAAEAVAWVKARGIPYLFVTNTTSRGRGALVEKLAGFGVAAEERDILTPCEVAADWLRGVADSPVADGPVADGPVALFVRAAARGAFAGLEVLEDGAESGARYVVVGDLGSAWDYATLNRAFRLLHADPEARLIALGMTRFWMAEDGISLDAAPFVAALEQASGRKALVFGKPAEAFFVGACGRLGLEPGDVSMVGDDIETDVGGAQRAGLRGVLVRTGKFREIDLAGAVRPDAVIGSVADLPGLVMSLGGG